MNKSTKQTINSLRRPYGPANPTPHRQESDLLLNGDGSYLKITLNVFNGTTYINIQVFKATLSIKVKTWGPPTCSPRGQRFHGPATGGNVTELCEVILRTTWEHRAMSKRVNTKRYVHFHFVRRGRKFQIIKLVFYVEDEQISVALLH